MTISATSRRAGPYQGNGVATSFAFSFKVFSSADIAVSVADVDGVETTLVLDSDYTVTLNSNQETSPGGTVTYPITGSPLADGERLGIVGNLPFNQPLDLPAGGNFSPLAIENELDRIVMQVQQLDERLDRSVVLPATSSASNALPVPEAGSVIGWDQVGSALTNYSQDELITAVTFANWTYDTFTGTGSASVFALDSSPGSLGNVDVSIDGLSMVPGTDFSISGSAITFTVAPASGAEILVRYGQCAVQGGATITSERKIATASQTVFTLSGASYVPGSNNIAVYVNGVRLSPGVDFAETNSTTVTMSSPLALSDEVLLVVGSQVAESVGAANVGFLQAGTGAVARTSQTKMRERISLQDFGAVGDGITDDSDAFEAAVTYAASLDDGVTAEGVPVVVTGSGTFAVSRTIELHGESVSYQDLSVVAIDGDWSDTPLVVLATGEANMRGNNGTGGTWKSNTNVYAWLATAASGAGAWIQNPNFQSTTYYVPGTSVSMGGGANNAALAFCYRLQEASNRPVRLVIECAASQAISQWIGSGTSSARYAAMEARLTEALAAISLASAKVDVFLWQQGESNTGISAATYEGYLNTLFTQLEAEPWWDTANTASILGELHDDNAAYNNLTTGIHQRFWAHRGLTMFAESAGLSDVGDTIHYDGTSLFEIGYRRYFTALMSTTKSWASPVLKLMDPAIKLQNVHVFPDRKAAGIDVASGSAVIDTCEITHALCYGIRLKGSSGDSRVVTTLVTGLRNGDALFASQDNWTARGVWNGRADNKMIGTVVRWCPVNLFHDYDAATFTVMGCHLYAGGSGVLVTDNPINAEIRGGGINLVGCYIDNGRVDVYTHNVTVDSPIMLCNTSSVSLDQVIGVFANGSPTPYRIFVSDVMTVSTALTDGTTPVLQYLPYASQTWTPNFTAFNAAAPADIETCGTKTVLTWTSNEAVHRFSSGNSLANGAKVEFQDADTTTPPIIRSSGDDLVLNGTEVKVANTAGYLVELKATGAFNPRSADDMTLGSSGNQWATGYINNIVQAAAATGGAGSGGAGNQYVALRINGVTYKLLHDGTL